MATEATEKKQFNLYAVAYSTTLLAYLGGSVFALVSQQITFTEFLGAVGFPLGGLTGWAAKAWKGAGQ